MCLLTVTANEFDICVGIARSWHFSPVSELMLKVGIELKLNRLREMFEPDKARNMSEQKLIMYLLPALPNL